jgi:hypothetical protein
MSSADLEKRSLEAHVDLCAERYKNLHDKLDVIGSRLDKFEQTLVNINNYISNVSSNNNKTFITVGTSILGVLLTGLIGVVIHLATK